MPSIDDLMREIEQLRAENGMLKMLLKENGIALPVTVSDADSSMNEETPADTVITKRSSLPEKVSLFLSLFQGRPDVYARRWERKNGRSGYSPACKNEWKPGICLKPKGKCADCSHAEYCSYGSINLLSFSTSQESIMRLHSSSIARALMNTEEGKTYENN